MNHRETQIRKRLADRIKFVDGPFNLKDQLAEIGTGVLFIRALWSGQCALSFRAFCNAVSQTPANAFSAHIVDNDQCNPAECKEILGEVSHGYGESFWIKDGAVRYADRGYHNGPLTRLLKKRIKEFSGIEVEVPGDGQEDVFAAMVMRNCQGLDPALIEIYDLECKAISDLEFAVVTLYHPNHAICITTLRALTKALAEAADPRIRMVVLNSDAVSIQDLRRVFGKFFGSGLTYWIRKGKVVASDQGYIKGEVTLPARRIRSLQALVCDGNVEKALRSIPKPPAFATPAVYRGWMMTPEQYLTFYRGLSALGLSLINQPQAYKYCHYLPEWLPQLCNISPETSVLQMTPGEPLTREQVGQSLSSFGADAAIGKDFVKSEKHHWSEACYIPDASDTDQALGVAQRFLQLRGNDLQGGLVFRKFKLFRNVGTHPKSQMPLTEEFRAFVLDSKVMTIMNYWDEVENGEWMIVELGDGQVAGLPENADLKQFYEAFGNGSTHPRCITEIYARIRLYDTAESGLKGPISEGFRCPMKIDGKDDAYHDCAIDLKGRTIQPGQTFEARIQFLCPELVALWLRPGKRFWLWSGKMIAEGETINVVN